MTSEQYQSWISLLKKERIMLDDEIIRAKQAWVDEHHPLKIGDIVPATEYQRSAVDITVRKRYVRPCIGVWEWAASGPIVGGNGLLGEWARVI